VSRSRGLGLGGGEPRNACGIQDRRMRSEPESRPRPRRRRARLTPTCRVCSAQTPRPVASAPRRPLDLSRLLRADPSTCRICSAQTPRPVASAPRRPLDLSHLLEFSTTASANATTRRVLKMQTRQVGGLLAQADGRYADLVLPDRGDPGSGQLERYSVGSVIKKRRKRMAKKKHRKLLKKTRVQRRKLGK
jgi:hypothetical protein